MRFESYLIEGFDIKRIGRHVPAEARADEESGDRVFNSAWCPCPCKGQAIRTIPAETGNLELPYLPYLSISGFSKKCQLPAANRPVKSSVTARNRSGAFGNAVFFSESITGKCHKYNP